MNKQRSLRIGFGLALASLTFAAAASTVGCAAIVGIEKREEPEDGFTKIDSGVRTSQLCIQYCDTLELNCEDELYPYLSRVSCLNTCNALPEGDEAEPIGNTVYCRLDQAEKAKVQAADLCGGAGPGGQDACGSNCDAWCALLESSCPEDFGQMDDCQQACAGLKDNGVLDLNEDYDRDTLQCRLIHLGAVGEEGQESTHCGHARYVPAETCLDEDPSCDAYCDLVMANCQDTNAVYEDRADCLAACGAFELGGLGDEDTNTVGCRTYHAQAAAGGPAVHCSHASPSGDGVCGSYSVADDGFTGNCESYCQLMEVGCGNFFTSNFTSVEECATSCAADFAGNGAENGSKYSVDTARDEDSLQCRIFYAVRAAAGEAAECIKAAPGSNCD